MQNLGSNSEDFVFENDEHQSSVLHALKEMYDANILVDVTLIMQCNRLACHRAVLAASIPYFHAMFTTDLRESRHFEVELHDVDPQSVRALVEYAYTGCIRVTPSNVQAMLQTAVMMQMREIVGACASYMQSQLDACNCLGVHRLAELHGLTELASKAFETAERNFAEVRLGEEWVLMEDVARLTQLLSSDELNVKTEEEIVEAIRQWIQYNTAGRICHLAQLLRSVRFSLLNQTDFEERMSDLMIAAEIDYQELSTKLFMNTSGEMSVSKSILRWGMVKPDNCILIIGGDQNSTVGDHCYSLSTSEEFCVSHLGSAMNTGTSYYTIECAAGVVTEDNQIYIAGGSWILHDVCRLFPVDDVQTDDLEDNFVQRHFHRYDVEHNCWQRCASLLFARMNFALAVVDQHIYCFGGLGEGRQATEMVECYDMKTNRWHYLCMMPSVGLIDLAAVSHRGVVYILGGRTGVTTHASLVRLDPATLDWIPLAPMITPRSNFGACVVTCGTDAEIYVIGGQKYTHAGQRISRQALHTVEIYNIAQNKWRQGVELPTTLHTVGAFVIDNTVHACGIAEIHLTTATHRSTKRRNVIYRLDPNVHVWSPIDIHLSQSYDSVCVAACVHTQRMHRVIAANQNAPNRQLHSL